MFDIKAAREAGYSDDEIADYLAQKGDFDAAAARESGYSAPEIIAHLSKPKGMAERAMDALKPAPQPEPETFPAARTAADSSEIDENYQTAANAGSDYWTGGTEKKKPKTGSVTDSIPSANPSGPPINQSTRVGLEYGYATASPERRERMKADPGYRGQSIRANAPSVEARVDMMAKDGIAKGADAEANLAYAQRNAVVPDAGQARAGTLNFDAKEEFADSGVLARAAAKTWSGLSASGGGTIMAAMEFLGADPGEVADVAKAAKGRADAIGEKKGASYLEQSLENVLTSIGTQAPAFAAMIRSGGVSLIYMGVQTAGQEYVAGRQAGLTPDEALARASAFGAAEAIGERFGLPGFANSFRKAMAGRPAAEVMRELGFYASREVPGELLTATLQTATDKNATVGLNQNITIQEFVKQLGDTVVQTVMQVGLTSGSAMGVRRLAEAAKNPQQERMAAVSAAIDRAVNDATINPQAVDASAVDRLRNPAAAPVTDMGLAIERASQYRANSAFTPEQAVAIIAPATSVDEAIRLAGAALDAPTAASPGKYGQMDIPVPPLVPERGYSDQAVQTAQEAAGAAQEPQAPSEPGLVEALLGAPLPRPGGVISGAPDTEGRQNEAAEKRSRGELLTSVETDLARQYDARPAPALAAPGEKPPSAPAETPFDYDAAIEQDKRARAGVLDSRGVSVSIGGMDLGRAQAMTDKELDMASRQTRSAETRQIVVAEQMRRRQETPQSVPQTAASVTPGMQDATSSVPDSAPPAAPKSGEQPLRAGIQPLRAGLAADPAMAEPGEAPKASVRLVPPGEKPARAAEAPAAKEPDDGVTQLITRPVRDFHKSFGQQIREGAQRAYEEAEEFGNSGKALYKPGERIRSEKTKQVYTVTGYSINSKLGPSYRYERRDASGDVVEAGTFVHDRIKPGMFTVLGGPKTRVPPAVAGEAQDIATAPDREEPKASSIARESADYLSERSEASADDRATSMDVARGERKVDEKGYFERGERQEVRDIAENAGRDAGEVEAEVRRQKARHPLSAGWAPLRLAKIDPDEVKVAKAVEYKVVPWTFHQPAGMKKAPKVPFPPLVEKLVTGIVKEVRETTKAAKAGDKNAQAIVDQMHWYRDFTKRLRQEFGGFGDTFADLIGATSARQNVTENYKQASEIATRFLRGEFDVELRRLEDYVAKGGSILDFPSADKIRSINGALFGMNSTAAMRALLGVWREAKKGSAPKTRNFAANLAGTSIKATIDSWAARTLQRLAGKLRIPVPAEGGVGGDHLTDPSKVGGAFGFGQKVFEVAAQRLSAAGVEITPADLQAMMWFKEKALWTKNDWGSELGDEGSLEAEAGKRELDRYQGLVAVQQGDAQPAEADVGAAVSSVDGVLKADSQVFMYRMIPSKGGYMDFSPEENFDLEAVVDREFDPMPLFRAMVAEAKKNSQDAVGLSRVVRPDEQNANARPGIEVSLRKGTSEADVLAISAALRTASIGGEGGIGAGGFTLAVDPKKRRTVGNRPAGEYIGIRVQFVPEIFIRSYHQGYAEGPVADRIYDDLTSGNEARVQKVMQEARVALNKTLAGLRSNPAVAYAEAYKYDTLLIGKEAYGDYTATGSGEVDSGAESGVWPGSSAGERLRDAARGHAAAIGVDPRSLRGGGERAAEAGQGDGQLRRGGGQLDGEGSAGVAEEVAPRASQNRTPPSGGVSTSTPSFKRWFRDSKVVDGNGNPLVVYHGTTKDFGRFSLDFSGSNLDSGFIGQGFYFSDHPETAGYYAGVLNDRPGANLIPVYLSLQNPFMWGRKDQGVRGLVSTGKRLPGDLTEAIERRISYKFPADGVPDADKNFIERQASEALRSELISRGYDGVIATFKGGGIEAVAFRPEQIKSAIGNNGEFDPKNPDILASGTFPVPQVSAETPVFRSREQQPDAVTVVAVRYGREKRTSLNGRSYGKGVPGQEFLRIQAVRDPNVRERLLNRVYFYAQTADELPRSESIITGNNVSRVKFTNLYDLAADPRGLRAKAKAETDNAPDAASLVEQYIIEAGFDGYLSKNSIPSPALVLLDIPGEIPAEYLGFRYAANEKLKAQAKKREYDEVHHEQIRTAIADAIEKSGGKGMVWKGGTKVNLVPTEAEVPAGSLRTWLSEQGDGSIEGVYDPLSKEIWVISKNLSSVDRAIFVTTTHEVTHAGLRIILPPETLAPIMRQIHARNKGVREAAAKKIAQGLSLETAVEEVLADMPDRASLKGWDRLVKAIKDFLSDLTGIKWTDDQVEALVAASRAAVRDGLKSPFSATTAKQTDTSAFRAWFGESVVREPRVSTKDPVAWKDKAPLVVYHGTDKDFSAFEPGRVTVNSGTFGPWETRRAGIFFAEEPKFAQGFAEQGERKRAGGANIIPVYLSIQNPVDLRNGFDNETLDALEAAGLSRRFMMRVRADEAWELFDEENDGFETVRIMQAAGFDGALTTEVDPESGDTFDVWVAFRPEQIKSAIGNRGTFDPKNPDIVASKNDESTPASEEEADLDFTPRVGLGGMAADIASAAEDAEPEPLPDSFKGSLKWQRSVKLMEALALDEWSFKYGKSESRDWNTIIEEMRLGDVIDRAVTVKKMGKPMVAIFLKQKRVMENIVDFSTENPGTDNIDKLKEQVAAFVQFGHHRESWQPDEDTKPAVWVDASALTKGEGGKAVYQLIATWADNNGAVFVPDPASVSPSAIEARVANGLSAALRAGTTKHLYPFTPIELVNDTIVVGPGKYEQWAIPAWLKKGAKEWSVVSEVGDDGDKHNMRLLMEAQLAMANIKLKTTSRNSATKITDDEVGLVDNLDDFAYDFKTNKIVYEATNEPVAPATLDRIAEALVPPGVKIPRRGGAGTGAGAAVSARAGAQPSDAAEAGTPSSRGARAALVRAVVIQTAQNLTGGNLEKLASSVRDNRGSAPGTPRDGILASRRPDWVESGSADLKSAASKVDTYAPDKTFRQKVDELKTNWAERFVQGVFDAYAPLKRLGRKEYILARMVKSADASLEATLLYGKPRIDADGVIHGTLDKKGFIGHMQDLNGEHDRFLMWVAGNRANRLKGVDRENLFTNDEIAAMMKLDDGKMKDGSSRKQAFAKAQEALNSYNKAVLDIAEKTGLIDGESRKTWEHEFYVPFFRVDEDMKIDGPSKVKGLVRQKAFERLKGGKENLGDLLDNTLRNWSHLLSASLANQAALASLKAATRAGIATDVPQSAAQNMVKSAGVGGATFAMDGGVQHWFIVDDVQVLDAISAVESASFKGLPMELMGKMKHYLTLGVTVSPTFRIRNLMRDSISAIAQSDLSYNVAGNVWKGFKGTNRESKEYAEALFNGALIRFGQLTDGKHAEHAKRLILSGVDDATILDTPQKAKAALGAMWDWWQETGDRAENVNRMSRYMQGLARGESALEAAFASRDMMDFSLQGSWAATRFLTQIVPFMNARLQGMYKLGRAAKEDPARMGYVVAATALTSIALLLAYKDDDEWKKREDWDRDNFWWFRIGDKAFRIAKPFEIGAMGTLAERSVELVISDEMTGKRFGERLRAMLGDTLALNPTPQLFKPMIDIYANKDSFSGRMIEGRGMENLTKSERSGPNTSLVAKAVGKAGDVTNLSPVQVDHLIRSYFGWLGSHAAMTVDLMAQPFMDVEKPARRLDDVFVLGDFVKGLPSNRSRYVEDFYKQAKVVHEVMGDLKRAREVGQIDKVREIMEERRDDIALSRLYTGAERKISEIGRRVRVVQGGNLSAEVKRQRLDELEAQRARVAEQVERIRASRRAAKRSPALSE